ncbi:N2,N2-dimethylguanosine tRNA methyltransferase [Pseudovirgaria hyperparasitica]|uniref:tRNA (guanine(26)-N(2))-dimethyltransferase n=1 Tax=Pseudovirgaria hyperparasitica TaxID=470096 RepID=A0A6A6WIN4_9PEZI|nr:N2,N2-dimethylguanosine tRNA methyltransferase [Pseudovirgaria hyperparasitica]KAF2761051.1 N2,N2-dimethylguanosine tRNA methyltransferase [Pseudovirgaria hyperparasitica]
MADKAPVSLSTPPAAGQLVEHAGITYTTVKEGHAHILVPPESIVPTQASKNQKKHQKSKGETNVGADAVRQSVFYNPIQQFNRDLSVLAIRAFSEDYLDRKKRKREAATLRRENKDKRRKVEETHGEIARDTVDAGQSKSNHEDVSMVDVETTTGSAGSDANHNEMAHKRKADDAHLDQSISDSDLLLAEQNLPQSTGLGNVAAPKPQRPDIRILDALSASGLRALRYAKELPFHTAVTANDLSKQATEAIRVNVEHNRLQDQITARTSNAMAHMYSFVSSDGSNESQKYHVIDLDPYGTAAPFLDSTMHAIQDGGLLCVTCTDSAIFNSTGYLEKTYTQYGGLPIKGWHLHEGGLRLVLHSIATTAARYGMAIEPLLSLSIDYYIRVFVRVHKSPADVKFLAGKQMIVYNCDAGCGAWKTQYLARSEPVTRKDGSVYYKHKLQQAPSASPLCEFCEKKMHLSGPMFGGPLHNPAFIEKILSYLPNLDGDVYQTIPRMEGMLQTAYDEIFDDKPQLRDDTSEHNDNTRIGTSGLEAKGSNDMIPRMNPAAIDHFPFYFIASHTSSVIRSRAPPDAAVKGALRHAGYRATRSHTKPATIRTDAPWSFIWKVFRAYARENDAIKEGALPESSPGFNIMKVDDTPKEGENTTPKIIFDEELGRDKVSKKLVRYQTNPRANWGPMRRAK